VVADLYVTGAAAMALAYDSRRATRDVECVVRDSTALWASPDAKNAAARGEIHDAKVKLPLPA
jgi:hypothetical protein